MSIGLDSLKLKPRIPNEEYLKLLQEEIPEKIRNELENNLLQLNWNGSPSISEIVNELYRILAVYYLGDRSRLLINLKNEQDEKLLKVISNSLREFVSNYIQQNDTEPLVVEKPPTILKPSFLEDFDFEHPDKAFKDLLISKVNNYIYTQQDQIQILNLIAQALDNNTGASATQVLNYLDKLLQKSFTKK